MGQNDLHTGRACTPFHFSIPAYGLLVVPSPENHPSIRFAIQASGRSERGLTLWLSNRPGLLPPHQSATAPSSARYIGLSQFPSCTPAFTFCSSTSIPSPGPVGSAINPSFTSNAFFR